MEGATVEVKIGITDSPRELVFSSPQTPGEVEELVSAALREGSSLVSLSDDKGRRFLIQTTKIAYVEIGAADARRVGFGIGADSAARSGGKAGRPAAQADDGPVVRSCYARSRRSCPLHRWLMDDAATAEVPARSPAAAGAHARDG